MFHKYDVPSIVASAVMTVAFCGPVTLADVPMYHVTLLEGMIEEVFPGVEFPSSDARGLNENGDLVGEARLNGGQMQGFVYTVEHGVTPLPLPAGWTSAAIRDVTDRGENGEIIIVGGGATSIYVDITIGEAVLWRFSTVTGEVLETRNIGIPAGFDDSLAVAVNNDATVVGFSGLTGPYTNWKYDVSTQVLETFEFPWRVTDLNNVGQVCGGSYRGDLFGNYEDLTDTYEPGDVMPDWAIENGGISASWHRINDQGWLVGRAGTGISDGAGHYYVAIVRYADPIGWTGMAAVSHLSLAGGIDDQGDFMSRQGGVFLEDVGQQYSINALLAPESQPLVSVAWSNELNNNQQVAGSQAHAFLLTPIGEMIIPGDVNGDVEVNRDDYCAWLAAPIDLNGDSVIDPADEQWLIERLLVFGWTLEDCNANGAVDHCDILDDVSADCDENDVPDECQPDCNGDGFPDVCEPDCNTNGNPDPCDILGLFSMDCNANGIPDECDDQGSVTEALNVFDPPVVVLVDNVFVDDLLVTGVGTIADVDMTIDIHYRIGELTILLSHGGVTVTICDQPGIVGDEVQGNGQFGYDITVDDEGAGDYLENVGNFGSPFEQIVSPPSYKPDEALSAFDGMPGNGIWTLTIMTSSMWSPANTLDDWGLIVTLSSAPVSCDCNGNGVMDVDDIANGTSADCDGNVVPDECELSANDCNGTGTLDTCDTTDGTSVDCNANNVPDECEGDCNGTGIPDDCDVLNGTSTDCDSNLVPDECDLITNDCNGNGVVDACDISDGSSGDCNINGVPDECEGNPSCDNDWCADALAICPGSGQGSTTGANRDGDAACDGYHKSPDVWYAYTPGSDGLATFSTCTSPYDTLLSVHTGCPGNQSNELACNDDACGTHDSSVTWDVTAGVKYLIRVAGYLNSSGDFTLTLSGPECSTACEIDTDCDDGNPCTDDVCEVDGVCTSTTNSVPCDDGDGCTTNDACLAGVCVGGPPMCSGVGCDDCNENGRPDSCDIADGASADGDGDGIPDECAAAATCVVAADCADPEDTGKRADNCMWWDCAGGTCAGTPVVFADLGGPFGDCAPDGVADSHDRFHALNCFADTAISGAGSYGCENAPPAAYNVDAGGPFGDCLADGVCDGNDAFHVLSAFEDSALCSCPLDSGGGPAPRFDDGPLVTEHVSVTLQPQRDTIRGGATVEVEVLFDTALQDLRGYQLHVGVSGGDRGQLQLIDMAIHKRKGHVFSNLPQWSAFNIATAQMVAGLDTPGVPTPKDGYVATLIFAASHQAAGTFVIDLRYDDDDATQRTFLFPTPLGSKIAIVDVTPAVITVETQRKRKNRR